MLTATVLAITILGQTKATKPIVCPIMLSPISAKVPVTEYNGALFGYCCAGCEIGFEANPTKVLSDKKIKDKTVGEFLFDPIDGEAIEFKKAAASMDFNSIRFYFRSTANFDTFKKDPKKFGTLPSKESMACPVSGEKINTYSDAAAFVDHKGVRYYICCMDCYPKFKAEPDKYAANVQGVGAPKAIPQKDK